MTEWTVDTVAERFAEAADTARRLPPVRVQGYFNLWPPIQRQRWESWGSSDIEPRPLPPDPAAIEPMLETTGWVLCLSVEERRLVWMRAKGDLPGQGSEPHGRGCRFGIRPFGIDRMAAPAIGAVSLCLNTSESATSALTRHF